MSFRIKRMDLECNKPSKAVEFSQVTYFYGTMASGKTTIAHLIAFCLGGDFDKDKQPTAIKEELQSVKLTVSINEREVSFERDMNTLNQIKITWEEKDGKIEGRLVPILATPLPILGEQVFNVSDIMFYFLGQTPLKVPLGDNFVRLSFRDVMWYCYLRQEELIFNFFHLGENMQREKMLKSRYVFRYLVGLFDEKLYDIEKRLHDITTLSKRKAQDIDSVGDFLKKFGFDSNDQLDIEIKSILEKLNTAEKELANYRAGYRKETHFVDDLRRDIVELSNKIANMEKAQTDLSFGIEEKLSLRAELFSSKSKLNRSISAKEILEGAKFDSCPACGLKIKDTQTLESICFLCGQNTVNTKNDLQTHEVIQLDLKERIRELEESIEAHQKIYNDNKRSLAEIKKIKQQKDSQLEQALIDYDSKFLANTREIEKQIATYDERIQQLLKISKMPQEISKFEKDLIALRIKENALTQEKELEFAKRTIADTIIKEIEESYRETLLAINLPNITADDRVEINRDTWIPEVIPHDKTRGRWSFFNISSAGMAALLNVCYALAIHKVASKKKLPLPGLLIIDSLAVDKDVDRQVFDSFYSHLYKLANSELADTQFILIDNYYAPAPSNMKILTRYMTRDDPNNPPLISYRLESKRPYDSKATVNKERIG